MRSRRDSIAELRTTIACLPRATRVAMLEGLDRNDIIVGAYSNPDGICPMLAAHRAGGRTNVIAFAEAWDRFAQRDRATKRARRANERELLILRTHLRASLLEEETGGATLAAAIAEHGELISRRPRQATPGTHRPRQLARGGRRRPGDPDRSRELGGRGGWAWTRIFRRYDDYERALERLAQETPERTPSAV